MISRRTLLKSAVLGGFALSGAIAATSRLSLFDLRLEHVSIPLPDGAKDLDGYRIGFLTDLHLGVWLPDEIVERAVELLKQETIDLLLLGGDYLWVPESAANKLFASAYRNPRFCDLESDSLPAQIFSQVARIISSLTPPDGIWGVMGNHDQWVNPVACRQSFHERGIPILVNKLKQILRGSAVLSVVAVDDYWTGVPDIRICPDQKQPNEMRLLLSHNPDYVSHLLSAAQFEFDLALCGHTHGGQIKLPLLGAIAYNIQDTTLAEGLVRRNNSLIYTSRGIGVVELPFRLNCPPEVTVFTLTSA